MAEAIVTVYDIDPVAGGNVALEPVYGIVKCINESLIPQITGFLGVDQTRDGQCRLDPGGVTEVLLDFRPYLFGSGQVTNRRADRAVEVLQEKGHGFGFRLAEF